MANPDLVFYCCGQSNMEGRGGVVYTSADSDVKMWRNGAWENLVDPYDPNVASECSCIPMLGNTIVSYTGGTVGFVPCADGGVPVGTSETERWSNELSVVYTNTISAFDDITQADGIIFMGCEGDQVQSETYDDFTSAWDITISRLRTHFGNPNLKIYISVPDYPTATEESVAVIKRALIDITRADSNQFLFAVGTGLSVVANHYNKASLDYLGQRIGDAIIAERSL